MIVCKPINFNPYVFERDSDARYYDGDGIQQVAGVDQLRFGYDPTTLEFIGPIIEGATDNWLLYSDDFTNAAWTKSGGANVTPDAHTSIDGTSNATQWDGEGDISQALSLTGDFIFSIYVKPIGAGSYPGGGVALQLRIGPTTTRTTTFNFYSDHAPVMSFSAGAFGFVQVLQNGWYRISTRSLNPEGLSTDSVGITSAADDPFYISKAQLEVGYSPTSYIEATSTAGSRAADVYISQSPSVVSNNIPEDDADVWDDGTAYVADNLVMVLGQYHRVYKSLTSNTDKFPPSNPTDWVDTGATVAWRMFDMSVGADKQSLLANDDIDISVAFETKINSLFLFNVSGKSVILTMYYDGDVYHTRTVNLIRPISEPSWYSYYFETRTRIKDVAFVDLPPASPSTIRIQVIGDGETTAIGKMIIGYGEYIGFAEYGSTGLGIRDFSTKDRNAFGDYAVTPRRFVGKVNVKLVVEPGTEIQKRDLLATCRSISCAYIEEDSHGQQIMCLGFFNDFSILFSTTDASYCSLDLEGI